MKIYILKSQVENRWSVNTFKCLSQWRKDSMYIPEGRRHCPNFLWGLPASAASCRLPPLSDRVGLRSCCWLLVCMRKNQAVNARNAALSSVHWSESLFYFKKGRKQVGKTIWTHTVHHGKEKVKMSKKNQGEGKSHHCTPWRKEARFSR